MTEAERKWSPQHLGYYDTALEGVRATIERACALLGKNAGQGPRQFDLDDDAQRAAICDLTAAAARARPHRKQP
ncbi:MAG TPA: hypothetical protein VKH82_00955 [Candidatus Binatia bacterium]|nr:hypothetical protein [Candidatus Binatia bacterium]